VANLAVGHGFGRDFVLQGQRYGGLDLFLFLLLLMLRLETKPEATKRAASSSI
jgi:hypothetical protein